ncbi:MULTISPECIES: LysM peptidoglycan-binding domain-containing protein [unclassified Clostridium]|uniref:LysM peptidoglycan-binding domain-containing protein n=1 Tax=unclassified Clostridium TaxID=2614128 RepID=UPI00029747F1|nr:MULTISPECIES: LysM peptidoglycan-binding domain-containing protein [unclassified Clostridium]EKQ51298.1 MAG: LysM domain-containing protein [Clostridium sp. Maddingley MBC34-26]
MVISKEEKTNSEIEKTGIDTSNYFAKLQCINYKLKYGETLTDIARKYESTCNFNSTIKMIKSINKIDDENIMNDQTIFRIPEYALENGKMYIK